MNPPTAQELLDQCPQYLKEGNTEEAIKLLQEIQSLPLTTRQQAIFWFCYGIAYRDKKDYDKAIEAYQEAIRLQPDYAAAYYNLGVAYYNKETAYIQSASLTEAKKNARQAARRDPDFPKP